MRRQMRSGKLLPLGDRAQPLVQEDEPGAILAALEGLVEQPVVRARSTKDMAPGRTEDWGRSATVRWRPARLKRRVPQRRRPVQEVPERTAKKANFRERVQLRARTQKTGQSRMALPGGEIRERAVVDQLRRRRDTAASPATSAEQEHGAGFGVRVAVALTRKSCANFVVESFKAIATNHSST